MKGVVQRSLVISICVCLIAWGHNLLSKYTLSYEASHSAFLDGCRAGGEKLECLVSLRSFVLDDRSTIISETLLLARLSGGLEKHIRHYENDLRRAIISSENSAHARAHINNFLRGVKAKPRKDQMFLVVDVKDESIKFNIKLRDVGSHDASPFSQELPANYYFARESRSLLPWNLPKWNPYIGSGFPQILDGHNPYYSPIQLILKLWPSDASRDFFVFFRIWYWVFGILLIVSQFSDRKIILSGVGLLAVLAPYHTNYIDISFLDVDLLAPFFPALVVLFQRNRLSIQWALFSAFFLGCLVGSMSFIQAQVVFCLSVVCCSIFFAFSTRGRSLLFAAATGCGFLLLWPSWGPIVSSVGEFISSRDFYPCYANYGLSFEALLRNVVSVPVNSTVGRYTFLSLPGLLIFLSILRVRLAWPFFAVLGFFGGLVIWGGPTSLCSNDWVNGVSLSRHSVTHATMAFLVLIGISFSKILESRSKTQTLVFWVVCLGFSFLVSSNSAPKVLFWAFPVLATLLFLSRYLFLKNSTNYRDFAVISSFVIAIGPTFWLSNKYLFLRVQQPYLSQQQLLSNSLASREIQTHYLDPTTPIGLIQKYSQLEDRRHHSPHRILDGNWSGAFGILDLKINMPLYPIDYWTLNSELFKDWSGKGLAIYPNRFFGPNSREGYFSQEFQKLLVLHRISLIGFHANDIQLNPSPEGPYSEKNCDLLAQNSSYSSYICRKVGGVGYFPRKVVEVKDKDSVIDYLKEVSLAEVNGLAVIYSDHLSNPAAAKGRILSFSRNGDDLAYDLQVEEEGIFVVADTYTKRWKAWVNENPSDIFIVNYIFKGVRVPKGLVHLRFKYR